MSNSHFCFCSYKKWVSMTTYLTRDLLQELQPLCGTITSVTQFESKCSNSKSRREEAEINKNTNEKVHSINFCYTVKP